MEFALNGATELDCDTEDFSKTKIPQMPTLWDELSELFEYVVSQRGGLMGTLLLVDENGEVNYLTLFCIYILPIIIIYGVYRLMWSPFDTDANTAERTRKLEEHNRNEKKKIDEWMKKHPKSK